MSARADGYFETQRAQMANGALVILGDGLDDGTVAALLTDARLPELRELSFGRNKLTVAAVRSIVSCPRAAHLRLLALDINPIGDEGLEALAAWPGLTTVEDLLVSTVGATGRGVAALAASPHLTALKRASFGFQAVGDAGAVALAALPASQWLQVERAEIGAVGARALIAGARTASLSLNHNAVGVGGLVGLGGVAPALNSLSLQDAGLGPADAAALAGAYAPSLRVLDLEYNDLGDAGIRALVGAAWFAQLDVLDVAYTRASNESYAALQDAWGERKGLTLGDGRPPK